MAGLVMAFPIALIVLGTIGFVTGGFLRRSRRVSAIDMADLHTDPSASGTPTQPPTPRPPTRPMPLPPPPRDDEDLPDLGERVTLNGAGWVP